MSSKSWRSKPRFIKAKEVISFNRALVSDTAENHQLLSMANLQNAIMRPINVYEYEGTADVCQLAAELTFGISKSHAFEQGNKRTAFVSCLRFIELNGFGYHKAKDGMKLGLQIIDMCNNTASVEQMTNLLRSSFVYSMTDRGQISNK